MLEPKYRLSIGERLGIIWCTVMHNAPMWPMQGNYRCRKCYRSYLVPWAGERIA